MRLPIMKNNITPYAKTALRGGFCGLALITLAACSQAPARNADTYYDVRPQITDIAFGSDKVLKIQSVSVKGLQSGRSLVIESATNPVQYQEVRGHLWHVAPSDLIETALADALIKASQDLKIGTGDTIDNEDLRLKIVVSQFHISPATSAHIAFDAMLKDKRGKIITSTRYQISEPVTAAGYEGAVSALEKGLSNAFSALAQDMAAAL